MSASRIQREVLLQIYSRLSGLDLKTLLKNSPSCERKNRVDMDDALIDHQEVANRLVGCVEGLIPNRLRDEYLASHGPGYLGRLPE